MVKSKLGEEGVKVDSSSSLMLFLWLLSGPGHVAAGVVVDAIDFIEHDDEEEEAEEPFEEEEADNCLAWR